jgi:hypothetical protein
LENQQAHRAPQRRAYKQRVARGGSKEFFGQRSHDAFGHRLELQPPPSWCRPVQPVTAAEVKTPPPLLLLLLLRPARRLRMTT